MTEHLQWEINATVARIPDADQAAIGRIRVATHDAALDRLSVAKADLFALLTAYENAAALKDYLHRAAVDNADRAAQLRRSNGHLQVENGRLGAIAFPAPDDDPLTQPDDGGAA